MSHFERLVRSALIGIVVCPPPADEPDVYRWLWSITVSQPATAIVCVTRFEPEWISALAKVPCADIVSTDEVDRRLEQMIARLAVPDVRRVLDQLSASARVLSRPCRDALASMCDSARAPVVTTHSLPALAATSPSAFYEAWNQNFPDCSPKRVMDWIALARAVEQGVTPGSAERWARWLGIHRRTFERTWLRCTGRTMAATPGARGITRFLRGLSACAEATFRRAMQGQRAG